MRTSAELDPTIKVWAEQFNRFKIPLNQYDELYRRAFKIRQAKMRDGDFSKVPMLDATLLVSCWTGEHGLAAELERKRIDERQYLPDTAASDCPRCFGAGMEIVPGKGARVCRH